MQTQRLAFFLFALFNTACSTTSLDPERFASQAADANRDESRIENALRTLCDLKLPEFCEKESRVLLENGKTDLALIAAARGCAAGRVSSCAIQGDILLATQNIREATLVLTQACESKTALEGVACPGAGEAAQLSNEPLKALRLWKRGCSLGNLVSCYYEGKALRLANRTAESLLPLKKSCDGNVLGSCSEYGISLMLEGRLEPALEKFALDCDRRSHRACRWLPLLEEKLKKKDLEKVLDTDCRKRNSLDACYDSITLQFLRKGGRNLALYRWKENCRAGHKMSCWEIFMEENGLKPISQSNPDLDRFCQEGILVACYFRGLNYSTEGKHEKALPLWSQSCSKGEPWSCFLASESTLVDSEERTHYRKKACELGMVRACAVEGDAQSEMVVRSKKPDPSNPREGCLTGDADACAYLGLLKAKNSEESHSDGEAKEHYRKACLASSTLGCEGLVRSLKP